jgi:hypothetical protein
MDRRVSPLELLYDLVYVAVIGQASHHLAEDVTGRAIVEFAIVFSLIWVAWINGSLYIELHGQEDGRTRSIVFVQMGILAVLAVFAGDAAGAGGRGFAIVYSVFLAFVTLLWFLVRQQDVIERPTFVRATTRYTAVIALLALVTFASAFVETDVRLAIWVVCVVGWIFLLVYQGFQPVGLQGAIVPTDSLVERFGLFTIIVLGEVVLGVVAGLSGADRDLKTIVTGMLALGLGFGFWWVYFRHRRRPVPEGGWALARDVDAEPPADHDGDHGGRGGVGEPDRTRSRRRGAAGHGAAAGWCRGARVARGDRHRPGTGGRGSAARGLPAIADGDGGGRCRSAPRRVRRPQPAGPRVAPRRRAYRALVLRGQPVPARGRVGAGGSVVRGRLGLGHRRIHEGIGHKEH